MAKGKNNGGVQNRAIYSRVSFLQQAAAFLACSKQPSQDLGGAKTTSNQPTTCSTQNTFGIPGSEPLPLQGMARRLPTDMRSVSLKTRIRLTPAVKQSVCKFCDSVLVEGQSCTSSVENRSRGGSKPWADILVRKCHSCQWERRYPINAERPKRKTERGGTHVCDTAAQPQKPKQKQKHKQAKAG